MFVIANNDLDNVADKVLEVLTALANGAKRIDKDVDVGFLRNHSWWYNPPKKLRGLLCWKQSIKYLQSFFWYFQPQLSTKELRLSTTSIMNWGIGRLS